MANIKQQKKRIRVAERQRMENIRYRSSIKTAFRRVVEAVQSGDADAVVKAHTAYVALVDRAVARKALHANTAARKKARITRVIARGPQVEETKKRRVTRKTAPKRATSKTAAQETAADESAEAVAEDTAVEVDKSAADEAAEAPAAEGDAAEADEAPAAESDGDDA